MNRLVKVLSTEIDQRARRIIKYLGFGRHDVRTSKQIGPYGTDAHPIPGMRALYVKSAQNGEVLIVGYINRNALAAVGEHRIYSTDTDGVVKTYIHLKNDGVMLLGGDADYAVRFNALKSEFDKLVEDHNSLVSKFNSHVHPGVQAGGGSTGATLTTENPSTADISGAKIETIKTP
jgi:hypothetical protein